MIETETNSTDLASRIALQTLTCQTFAFDTNVIVANVIEKIVRRKKWSVHDYLTSNIYICMDASRELLPLENVTYPTSFDQTVNGWISYIRDQFYTVSETEAIYYTIDNKDVDVWILIPTRDFKLLRRLVELEMKVLDTFSYSNESLYRLEFHIIYRNNADEETIVPSKAIRIPN